MKKCFCHPDTMGNLKISNLCGDFILISETRRPLEGCLDISQTYCQNWKLTVNNKKTKLLVVEKGQSLAQMHCFSLKKEHFEICKLYRYLGTIVTNNGNFKVNIQELSKNAKRERERERERESNVHSAW